MPLEIRQFPCLQDNYGFLIRDSATGKVATVDTPDIDAINTALATEGWSLDYILNTHHHWDHAGGNEALKKQWGCNIIGPLGEAAKIPGIDHRMSDGEVFQLGESIATIYETPGHTLGHIVYYFKADAVAFVGDTIFALGCGRLFEGTPGQMWDSLSMIAQWSPETRLYCAHEYTQANARFAITVDPTNNALIERIRNIDEARAKNLPTVPTNVAEECATNPFLRAHIPAVKNQLGMKETESDVTTFAEIRARKDNF